MDRKRTASTVEKLLSDLDRRLQAFGADYRGLSLRDKVRRLVNILSATRNLNAGVLVQEHDFPKRGARERLRLYFVANVGEVIDGDELAVVASIYEWGRRVRELRVEDGYLILTGPTEDDFTEVRLKKDQYLLTETEPDHTAARRWKFANRIRKQRGSASDRLLAFLKENVKQVVTLEELNYVGKSSENARRVRELRTEQGYAIMTHFTGRPDLKMGQYVLESTEPRNEPHDRRIPDQVKIEVYERDNNTCQACNWTRDDSKHGDYRFLELHHRQMHVDHGPNTSENLCVLCARCHDEVHAGRLPGFVDGEKM